MTRNKFRKKYIASNTSLLLFNDIIYKKVNLYDSIEECYHMHRYDWMIKTQNYLPANYSSFRNLVSQLYYKKKSNYKTKVKATKIVKFYRELQQ